MSNKYIGDFTPGVVVRFRFNMFSTSFVPTTPTIAPTFCVYKNSTVESTAGITVTVDYDGRAGVVFVAIDTSADPAFYVAGEDYDVMFTAGTVDGNDMARVFVRMFSLENRSRKANVVQIAGQNANAAAAVTFPASPAAVSDIPTALAIADAVLEESVDDHDGIAQSLAKYISIIKKANTVIDGTVTSATTPTATSFSSSVNYPSGSFKHAVLLFTNAAAVNEQNSPVLTYVNTNGVLTVEEPFTVAPSVGDEFIIIPTNHVHSIAAIQSGLATEASVAQIGDELQVVKDDTTALINSIASVSARIGSFAGSGVNTILGFFRALMRKDGSITTPSDVGGAFVHTTDSLEAIRDRGDAAWTSGGGAGGVTNITVEDRSITLD